MRTHLTSVDVYVSINVPKCLIQLSLESSIPEYKYTVIQIDT